MRKKNSFFVFLLASLLSFNSQAAKLYRLSPEIQCWQSEKTGEYYCGSLKPRYFIPLKSNAKFEPNRVILFYFKYARAHFIDKKNANVEVFYKNEKGEEMIVKNLYTSYIPVVSKTGWEKLQDQFYECNKSPEHCPILIRQ